MTNLQEAMAYLDEISDQMPENAYKLMAEKLAELHKKSCEENGEKKVVIARSVYVERDESEEESGSEYETDVEEVIRRVEARRSEIRQ